MPYVDKFLIYRRLYVFLGLSMLVFGVLGCNKTNDSPTDTACASGGTSAPLMIDSGQMITAKSATKVGAVLYSETQIINTQNAAECTATAVSTSTVVTAAHCLHRPNDSNTTSGRVYGKWYCVSDFARKRICSDKIFVDPDYIAKAGNNTAEQLGQHGLDFGFVVFPEGTFSEYAMVSNDALQPAEAVIMSGFSRVNLSDSSSGSKRFGWNRVDSLRAWNPQPSSATGSSIAVEDVLVKTNYGQGFSRAAVNHGDSGGPLFTAACEIAGVASMRASASGSGHPDSSFHTNLTSDYVHNKLFNLWMNNARLGYLCGLTGADAFFCPDIGRYRPLNGAVTPDAAEFPCSGLDLSEPPQTSEINTIGPSCPAQ